MNCRMRNDSRRSVRCTKRHGILIVDKIPGPFSYIRSAEETTVRSSGWELNLFSSSSAARHSVWASTMLDIFIRLKTLVKISHIHIDSSVFRLHWCISSVILLTFSVIVTTRQVRFWTFGIHIRGSLKKPTLYFAVCWQSNRLHAHKRRSRRRLWSGKDPCLTKKLLGLDI